MLKAFSHFPGFRLLAAWLTVFSSLLFLGQARASADEFLAAGVEIPQALQAKGYSTFGKMNLATLVSQMHGIRVKFSNELVAAKRNQNGRISARWEVSRSGRIIHVYAPSWNRFTDQRSLLALHEYLGILGYADNNYWLSTQMWTLSLQEAQALSGGERTAIERSIEYRTQVASNSSGGGVVGVGGGGEGGTIWVRQKRIRENLDRLNRGEGARDENVGSIYHELEGTVEAGYGGFESKAAKRAAAEWVRRNKPYCMVRAGLCKSRKPKFIGDNNCTCPGSAEPGTIIYTDKPW